MRPKLRQRLSDANVMSTPAVFMECTQRGMLAGHGRRLPTHGELEAALTAVSLAPGGELTSNVHPSSSDPGRLDVLVVIDRVGSVAVTPGTFEGFRAYRFAADPISGSYVASGAPETDTETIGTEPPWHP